MLPPLAQAAGRPGPASGSGAATIRNGRPIPPELAGCSLDRVHPAGAAGARELGFPA